ncbi:alpha/beta fold hydrolase [Pedobacter sandarakinus]|uniref:alpha/beta fold hydrolase n=1 Tax=Pedobacter sandarakinus TaxID=353156 RepID=UPI0022459FBA|nr:alpha/beta hydrolase [Pedobacter sandarakinus]MCX2575250.1 alpha/beta hydrolase [Pedobacter sandarakinus]
MKAYLISGLGADSRIFAKLALPSHIEISHIEWITPNSGEKLSDYAARLSNAIDTKRPFILIGVSFGGMLAVEIAKIFKPILTIIISSTIYSKHLPLTYRIVGRLNLTQFIPSSLFKSANKFTQNFFFGTKTKQEKKLLKTIVNDTDPMFLKWAISSIVTWQNQTRPENLHLIHGKADRILYSKQSKPDFWIEEGTHFMVYQKADQISKIISELVSGIR